jgi:hypothetical protein
MPELTPEPDSTGGENKTKLELHNENIFFVIIKSIFKKKKDM